MQGGYLPETVVRSLRLDHPFGSLSPGHFFSGKRGWGGLARGQATVWR